MVIFLIGTSGDGKNSFFELDLFSHLGNITQKLASSLNLKEF